GYTPLPWQSATRRRRTWTPSRLTWTGAGTCSRTTTWAARKFPERVEHLRAKLEQWGGNASGVNVANIDNLGNVHPDTFWWHHNLGNVRDRAFSAIWQDVSDPLMAGLKARPRAIKGRCGPCRHFAICGGNTRVRALKLTNDPWAEDPGCYLTDDEIGLSRANAAE
ncbi:MAG: hypothetical protein AAB543_09730, partial [Pseudomonadota bacterium]